ncbi:hypothetical protein COOONC_03541 [Cooperia oncophora]
MDQTLERERQYHMEDYQPRAPRYDNRRPYERRDGYDDYNPNDYNRENREHNRYPRNGQYSNDERRMMDGHPQRDFRPEYDERRPNRGRRRPEGPGYDRRPQGPGYDFNGGGRGNGRGRRNWHDNRDSRRGREREFPERRGN